MRPLKPAVRGPERRFHFEIEARYGSFSWSSWSNASNEFSRIDTEKPLVFWSLQGFRTYEVLK